jgi:hypothetical protein
MVGVPRAYPAANREVLYRLPSVQRLDTSIDRRNLPILDSQELRKRFCGER